MSDWPVGLSTGCFWQTPIFDCLERIRNGGFVLLEICSSPTHLDYRNLECVRRASVTIDALGIEAYSLHAPFADYIDITAGDHGERMRARDELLRATDAAVALGVRYLVIHPGPERGGFAEHERFWRMENAAAVLNEVSRACRQQGVALVLENMLPHLFSGNVRELMWLLGAMSTTDVGICLDIGHARLSGDLHTIIHKLSGHLWMVHASDNRGSYDDHLPPGEGNIPWERVLHQLEEIHFDGALMLEVAGQHDAEAVLAGARKARKVLRDISRRLRLPSTRP